MSKYFIEATGYQRVVLLSALAVASALLTHFAPNDPWQIMRVPGLYDKDGSAPILPGLYFGSVLAVGAYAWKKNNLFSAGVILVGTTVAWVVAYEFAFHLVTTYQKVYLDELCTSISGPLFEEIKKYRDLVQNPFELPKCFSDKLANIMHLLAGIASGLTGGIITLIGISLVTPEFRTINDWSRTLFVASLTGALLANNTNLLLLFIVWQVSVAASIAFGWSVQETLKVGREFQ